MTFPVLGGNGAVAGGYSIDNSLRFNDDDSPDLKRTPSSAGNRAVWTWSAWVKIHPEGTQNFFTAGGWSAGQDGTGLAYINGQFYTYWNSPSTPTITTAFFRDGSAWYHVVLQANTSTLKLYVNGTEQSSKSISGNGAINNTNEMVMGRYSNTSGGYFNGYMAEVHFIDGTAKSPTDFGEYDDDSGIWKPKEYEGTYGTNGFYLDFENSGSLGADQSGNSNNFTPTNLASTDQTTDTPTNNFATMNPLDNFYSEFTFSEGNCKFLTDGADTAYNTATIGNLKQGKWYFEIKYTDPAHSNDGGDAGDYFGEIGVIGQKLADTNSSLYPSSQQHNFAYSANNGRIKSNNTAGTIHGSSINNDGQIIGFLLDLDNNRVTTHKDGQYADGSGNHDEIFANASFVSITAPESTPLGGYFIGFGESKGASGSGDQNTGTYEINFGNPSFSISSGNSDDNGYGNFEYAPPSGYLALCTQNLATALSPTIDDGSQYFNTVLYSGTGATRSITGLGFSPDWTWIKERNNAVSHRLFDSVRGATKRMFSNNTDAESTQSNSLTSFDSDGFTLGDSGSVNGGSDTYVAWNWRGSDSNAVSNTDGTITSTVSANQTSGFSVVTYTGTGANATVGHGLGKAPNLVIVKLRSGVGSWAVYSRAIGATKVAYLENTSGFFVNSSFWNNTDPTSSVFSIGSEATTNTNGGTLVAYCFADIEGYSKIGTYTGNGSTDGTFVYTGFRPSWLLVKDSSAAENWMIYDNKRDLFNEVDANLKANSGNAETDFDVMDFVSNGFKIRQSSGDTNNNGNKYIYIAFASNPFVSSSGVPVVAR